MRDEMKSAKRKQTVESSSSKKTRADFTCFIHSENVKNLGRCVKLSKEGKLTPEEKLSKIKSIRDKRLQMPEDSSERMQDACNNIPNQIEGLNLDANGWHSGCYKEFTRHLERLKSPIGSPIGSPLASPIGSPVGSPVASPLGSPIIGSSLGSPTGFSESSSPDISPIPSLVATRSSTPATAKPSSKGTNLFPDNACIFCPYKNKRIPGGREHPDKTFSSWIDKESGWKNIERLAKEMQNEDLLRKVQNVDLFAAEAHFHQSCLNKFYSDYQLWKGYHRSNDDEAVQTQKQLELLYNSAYDNIKKLVLEKVLIKHQVLSMSVLRQMYVDELIQCGVNNPKNNAEKLKRRLQKDSNLIGNDVHKC